MLTRDLVRGNEEAWSEFFKRYHRRLRSYLSACWRGEEDCLDDLLQETLMRALRHMRSFDDEGVFWSWLTVLARSSVADHGRKETRLRRFLSSFRQEKYDLPPSAGALRASMAKLSTEDQQLLQWKYEEHRTVAEIATLLHVSNKAVESRLTRARLSLKKFYRP